jgi:hypothetical protein
LPEKRLIPKDETTEDQSFDWDQFIDELNKERELENIKMVERIDNLF